MGKKSGKRKRAQTEPEYEVSESYSFPTSGLASNPFPLTDECHHYTQRNQVPWDIQKYVQCPTKLFIAYVYAGIGLRDIAYLLHTMMVFK